jgi:chloramphenicol O-acetyltransferase type B
MGKLTRHLANGLTAGRPRRKSAPIVARPRVSVGRHTYGEPQIPSFTGSAVTVEIGSFCSIAANVTLLLGAGHNTAWVSTFPIRERFGLPGRFQQHPTYRGPTIIGNDVWIGRDVLILDGITIGHGAVIGARAVVTKDVRPYAVVGGVPAREIRRRFTDEQVDALLDIAWWEWADERIIHEVAALNGSDIDYFLARHGHSSATDTSEERNGRVRPTCGDRKFGLEETDAPARPVSAYS